MKHNNRVFIALGSNLGDRLGYLGKAILHLSQHEKIWIKSFSSVYETDPVGYLEQDPFYNMVIEIETALKAKELLSVCLTIEKNLGRERKIVNGPRTVDLDLLFFGDEILQEEDLILPHPRLHERAFVMIPLAEIAPEMVHPVLGKSCKELADERSKEGGVRRLALI